MMNFGIFLLVVAIAALAVGFVQQRKMKGILNAPFKKTGDIAKNPQAGDAKGTISCEGSISSSQPLTAPCSGRACIYYEIEVKQAWEKHVSTENGTKKQTGKITAHEEKKGSIFQLNDGSGPVKVNAMEKIDGQLEKSFEEKSKQGYGDIHFGQWRTHISTINDSSKYETGTTCIEKIIPAEGNLFVKGKLAGGQITKQDGMLGKLLLSTKGRDALVGATKRNMMIGFIVGGLSLPFGGGMAIFGDPPVDNCANMQDDIPEACKARVHDEDSVKLTWTVVEEGNYEFSSVGTGTDDFMRLWPHVVVTDASGTTVLELSAPSGDLVKGTAKFAAGTYTIEVNDTHTGWADNLEGGAGFSIDIDKAPDSPSDEAEEAAEPDAKAEEAAEPEAKPEETPA